jgi:hypothetical protein
LKTIYQSLFRVNQIEKAYIKIFLHKKKRIEKGLERAADFYQEIMSIQKMQKEIEADKK